MSELILLAALVAGCAPEVPIGEERRLAIRTAVQTADGRWREAGDRSAPATLTGWYGRANESGALPTITSLEVTPSAVLSSAVLGSTWIIAGSLGDRGFVRALDDNDATVWETTFATEGQRRIVRSISATNEGSLVVVGTDEEPEGAITGWAALLEASGAIRWERHFETDFQRTARGFKPEVVVSDPNPASPSRRAFWLAGTHSIYDAYALQMTFDGDLWDSEPFAVGGVSRGVAAFEFGITICTEVGGRVELAWTQGGAVSGSVRTELSLETSFAIATCFAGSNEVLIVGAFQWGGQQIPAVLAVDRATRSLTAVRKHPTELNVAIYGGARASDGTVTAFGEQLVPVRRWRGVMP